MNPFATWKQGDVDRFNARALKPHVEGLASGAKDYLKCEPPRTTIKERDLHEQILAECRRRQWIAFHGSMAHSTFRTLGEPDFVILGDGGKVLLVEAKTAKGKLSVEQQAIAAWALKLGHQIHVVRNFQDFLELSK